jgi:phage-related protein
MAKGKKADEVEANDREEDEIERGTQRSVGWLHGEIKTPPFTKEGRKEAGHLLRLLQEGENLGMPQAEPLSTIGPRCGALRVRDDDQNWRIVYRLDPDAVLVLEVYAKKTKKIPQEVIERCKRRLRAYDDVVRQSVKKAAKESAKNPKGL